MPDVSLPLPIDLLKIPLVAEPDALRSAFPWEVGAVLWDTAAYARAVATLATAASLKQGARITGPEAQALAVGMAMSVVAIQHGFRLPVMALESKFQTAAEKLGTVVNPQSKQAILVLAPFSFTNDGYVGAKNRFYDATTTRVLSAGTASIRAIKNAKYSSAVAVDSAVLGNLDVSVQKTIAPAVAVLGGIAIVVVGYVINTAVQKYFDPDKAVAIHKANLALSIELERQKTFRETGTVPPESQTEKDLAAASLSDTGSRALGYGIAATVALASGVIAGKLLANRRRAA